MSEAEAVQVTVMQTSTGMRTVTNETLLVMQLVLVLVMVRVTVTVLVVVLVTHLYMCTYKYTDLHIDRSI